MDPRFPVFHVETERLESEVHVRPVGELDMFTAPQLEKAIADAGDHPGELVIDLRALTFIDSTGIHVILRARATCSEQERGFSLLRGSTIVHRVFELSGLADRLPFR